MSLHRLEMSLRSKIDKALFCLRSAPAWLAMSTSTSYLRSTGWLRNRAAGMPSDARGEPIPWITYPSLFFLEPRVRPEMSIFEYGSGSSTLWWARRVRRVVSCEHDEEWFGHMRPLMPPSVEFCHAALDAEAYAREILKYESAFDIVVIDGRDRNNCARNSLAALKPSGVVLWDNSDREEYRPGFDFLERNGFRRIDFAGMGPLNVYQWTTSIFYRADNCLGL
jgi:hypothetical protein